MSKVIVNSTTGKDEYDYDKYKGDFYGVPIIYSYYNDGELFMLIRDAEDQEHPYKSVSLTNAHIQTTAQFRNLDEFFEAKKSVKFYDISINANEI